MSLPRDSDMNIRISTLEVMIKEQLALLTPYGRALTYGHLAIACMTISLLDTIALDEHFEDSST